MYKVYMNNWPSLKSSAWVIQNGDGDIIRIDGWSYHDGDTLYDDTKQKALYYIPTLSLVEFYVWDRNDKFELIESVVNN